MKALILGLPLLFLTFSLPAVNSQSSPGLTNGVVNAGFEIPNQAWDTVTQYGTVNMYDGTHARTGSLSAKLSAPINQGPPCTTGCDHSDLVAAFVGQQFSASQDYNLVNIADSPDSLAWWYVEPDQNSPYSLRIQILFSDGSTPTYVLGYFYGSSGSGTVNTTRSINYNLGPIPRGSWYESIRNVYTDLQAFSLVDPSSFHVTRIGFGAMGNYTNGETAWVDDTGLMFDRPSAHFTANQVGSQEVSFDASSSLPSQGATINQYTWDFGDGLVASSTQPSASHTYSSLGSKQVTLKLVDSRGHLSSASQSVTIRDVGPSPLVAYGTGLILIAVLPVALLIGRRRRKRR